MHPVDPELIFLKWAYRQGALDADALLEFNRRSSQERPGECLLELLLEWGYLSRDEMKALLDPAAIRQAVEEGRLDEKLVPYVEALELPPG